MTLKLTSAAPEDLFARMELRLFKADKDALMDENGDPYWIEFWSETAAACRDQLRRLRGPALQFAKKWETIDRLTANEANDLADAMERNAAEGLAFRVKDWRLPDPKNGGEDTSPNFEKAKFVFLDNDHELRAVCQEFLATPGIFTKRSSDNS